MAVAATDIALADLVIDRTQAETVAYQLHHRVPFLRTGAMIEVEDSEIGSATVDAGMSQKVVGDERDARGALRIRACTNHRDVVLAIALVVLARRGSIAVSTHFLAAVYS
ncbi:hypothetical protein [Microbacterium sp. A84]|uniref:hypothetical protein n=1 Tax=Microbacterium sp. A84 TaxID=3450715 RepID=UPI003F43757C